MSRLVIADTSPINYFVLIGHVDILPALFERVILPDAVWDELKHPKAPPAVKDWIASRPDWVDVRQTGHLRTGSLQNARCCAGGYDALFVTHQQ